MSRLWRLIGRVFWWLAWPGMAVAIPRTRRTRVLIVHGDEILLVRGWFDSSAWSLPGGGIKAKESAVEAARREVKEETGIELGKIEQLDNTTQKHRGITLNYQSFVASVSDKKYQKGNWFEVNEIKWVGTDSLPTDIQPHVRHALEAWRAKQ